MICLIEENKNYYSVGDRPMFHFTPNKRSQWIFHYFVCLNSHSNGSKKQRNKNSCFQHIQITEDIFIVLRWFVKSAFAAHATNVRRAKHPAVCQLMALLPFLMLQMNAVLNGVLIELLAHFSRKKNIWFVVCFKFFQTENEIKTFDAAWGWVTLATLIKADR